MTNQLAFKHKNSLAFKENKIISEEMGFKNLYLRSRHFRVLTFFIIVFCTFLGFWFIICPLTWAFCYSSPVLYHWFKFWPLLFWIVAFTIWNLIMIFFIITWKHIKSKHNVKIKRSYGSDGTNTLVHPLQDDTKLMILEDKINDKAIESKSNNNLKVFGNTTQNDQKKRSDLPLLVIHKRMSDSNIENANEVTTEQLQQKDDDKQLKRGDIQETNINRNSIKDYLKLVMVTPLEKDKKIISPKIPMSPRDLFFIDMIREAEKAEKDDTKRHSCFFPESPIASLINSTDSKNNTLDDKDSETRNLDDKDSHKNSFGNEKEAERESNYFIAEIESPKNEKTEVFIEINVTTEPHTEKEISDLHVVNLNEEKPILILESRSIQKDCSKKDTNM